MCKSMICVLQIRTVNTLDYVGVEMTEVSVISVLLTQKFRDCLSSYFRFVSIWKEQNISRKTEKCERNLYNYGGIIYIGGH